MSIRPHLESGWRRRIGGGARPLPPPSALRCYRSPRPVPALRREGREGGWERRADEVGVGSARATPERARRTSFTPRVEGAVGRGGRTDVLARDLRSPWRRRAAVGIGCARARDGRGCPLTELDLDKRRRKCRHVLGCHRACAATRRAATATRPGRDHEPPAPTRRAAPATPTAPTSRCERRPPC